MSIIKHYLALKGSKKIVDPQIPPVLIYQMGKVGSSSVLKSLKKTNLSNPIYHVHQLSNKGFERKESWLKANNVKKAPPDLAFNRKLRDAIDKNIAIVDWKIITLTREPLAVELSGVFENLKLAYGQFIDLTGKVKVDEIMGYLVEYFAKYDVNHNYYCNWFDEELKAVFGIDVYTHPYDFDKGYSIIQDSNIQVLLIRMEDLNRSFGPAMEAFWGLKRVKMVQSNIGEKKGYSKEYRNLLEHLEIPTYICKKVYSSKYSKHFYDVRTIDKLILKWSKKNTSSFQDF